MATYQENCSQVMALQSILDELSKIVDPLVNSLAALDIDHFDTQILVS
jgi:hypothetical protein